MRVVQDIPHMTPCKYSKYGVMFYSFSFYSINLTNCKNYFVEGS